MKSRKIMNHILIIEDEDKIREILRDYLEKAGFKVTCLASGEKAVESFRQTTPDLVLLDIMLPGKDGLDICREIRSFSKVPILMITARVDEVDRVLGLEIGADDYICKPFSPREVVARVKAALRRTTFEAEGLTVKTQGDINLKEDTHEAVAAGQMLKLTPIEFNLLRIFIKSPGRAFSRNELINLVQGYDYEGYDRTIDSHIKNLRKKIEACIPDREVICSVYGIGYKFLL
jgi:two-component system, OmpR family, response regulator BaeR